MSAAPAVHVANCPDCGRKLRWYRVEPDVGHDARGRLIRVDDDWDAADCRCGWHAKVDAPWQGSLFAAGGA